jgi:two-component system, NarL family, invasion response regulator UvrY
MKVLIVDDHPIVIEGCRRLLETANGVDIYTALNLTDAFRIYRKATPDVVILDLSLQPETLGGLSFIRRMRQHDQKIRIIVLSMHTDAGIARRAIALGANGYVSKDAGPQEFVEAVDKVTRGQVYVSADLALDLAFEPKTAGSLQKLTLRELEVLTLIAAGHRYGSIATELHVSYKTVVNTVSVLKQKLRVGTLPELTRLAVTELPIGRKARR